jgi:DNA-binding response OmpR family regulator
MKRVLLVDDEPRILKFLSLKLLASGYSVISAESGQKALDQVNSDCPDIVVMDIIMPGMDGVETLRHIRKISQCPVILFSARDHESEEIKKLGADDYLRKPFDPDELINRINMFMNGNS